MNMDRLKQKLKKEKSGKASVKDKNSLFITDVKTIKENLKIKEILRTVKMNSSMRLKAPPGSKVMCNKDFNEEDCFEESSVVQNSCEALSATNPDVIITKTDLEENKVKIKDDCKNELNPESENGIENKISAENQSHSEEVNEQNNFKQTLQTNNQNNHRASVIDNFNALNNGKSLENNRDRKLSLDHTMLTRQDRFSQSELDLHTIGKSPLERKYSFFRKKMDSFVRNTTEMFRRQNSSTATPSLKRRGSVSVSLQSLGDPCNTSDTAETPPPQQEPLGSRTSLQTPSPIGRSNSSLSLMQSEDLPTSSSQNSLVVSQPTLHALSNPFFEELHSNSAHSLNDAMLNSRAMSMCSGLDAPFGGQRRKASRSNRVTWIASEAWANYLRRKIQDENVKEMQSCHSYQDFSSIPENELYNRKPDTKGRRLSYQRAVSGEDPMRYQDSSLRRKHLISENSEYNV